MLVFVSHTASGAVNINSTQDVAWFHHGVWKLRFVGDYTTILQTRPHLEWHIEQYLNRIPNVMTQYNQIVQNIIYIEEENRITGVEIIDGSDSNLIMIRCSPSRIAKLMRRYVIDKRNPFDTGKPLKGSFLGKKHTRYKLLKENPHMKL